MTKTNKQLTAEWLYFASTDLRVAELSLNEELYNQVCFLSQQAAEKSLKALFAFGKKPIPRIHTITQLIQLLFSSENDKKILLPQAVFLDKFYIPTRYPDALPGTLPQGLPNKVDAQKSLEIAQSIYHRVLKVTEVQPMNVNPIRRS